MGASGFMAFGVLFRELRSVHYSVLSVLVLEHFKSLMFHDVRFFWEKRTHPHPQHHFHTFFLVVSEYHVLWK